MIFDAQDLNQGNLRVTPKTNEPPDPHNMIRRFLFDNHAYQKLSNRFYACDEFLDYISRRHASWVTLECRVCEQDAYDGIARSISRIEAHKCAGVLTFSLFVMVWVCAFAAEIRSNELT